MTTLTDPANRWHYSGKEKQAIIDQALLAYQVGCSVCA